MKFIFKQHCEWGTGREIGREKQCVHSSVLQDGSSEKGFTSTASPPRKEPRTPPLRRWGKPHFHFSSFVFSLHNVRARLDARPNQPRKKCQDRMSHVFAPPASSCSGRTAEVTPIRPRWRPPFSHYNIRTRIKCRPRSPYEQVPSPFMFSAQTNPSSNAHRSFKQPPPGTDLLPLQPAETSLRHVTFQTILTNNSVHMRF